MKTTILIATLALAVAGCATKKPVEPQMVTGKLTGSQIPATYDRNASRPSDRPLEVHTREDLENSGGFDTADALRRASVHVR